MAAYEREYEDLSMAVRTILRGFSEGVFVRSTEGDSNPGWALKLLPFLAALEEAQRLSAQRCVAPVEAAITAHVCGGKQARVCRVTGIEHDMSAEVRFKDGGSVACKDCGATAMDMDLMELP